jgi:hypothetical protein
MIKNIPKYTKNHCMTDYFWEITVFHPILTGFKKDNFCPTGAVSFMFLQWFFYVATWQQF